jgi:pyruvate-ferredoxin/flavodoxin oxidoreductase
MSKHAIMDGNEAAAHIAYQTNEVIAIYPITPASPMGEWADQWASEGRPNAWGAVPKVQEMQAEGGAAGAVHGALQAGALTTTFTASQGLLLMIPNMFKIAGELTSTVFHIAARSIACQALSIFGDHSDVMACRGTGFAMLFSANVQEVMDLALISHAATLRSRIPFLHIFDGFRTSHEISKIEIISPEHIRDMIKNEWVKAHRERALNPNKPFIRGTAQNPDVFFQARESVNPFYHEGPKIVAQEMQRFAELTGRKYQPFDYSGHPEAERVIVLMGSGCDTVEETIRVLPNEKVGVLKVRLFRPFSSDLFLKALPITVQKVAVLDRTKEPGSVGEPLYLEVSTLFQQLHPQRPVRVIGGRYGLSSKEFTPAMVKAVFDELKKDTPKNSFTIGIIDDLGHTHLDYDPSFITEPEGTVQAMFWGLGSDGTVGANKNSITIIGNETDFFAQGYFVYDSKKAGARTISHLRFGPEPIQRPYLIQRADFVAVHQFEFLKRYPVLDNVKDGAVFLLNSPYPSEETWSQIPTEIQQKVLDKKLKLYLIDAYRVASQANMGVRINTVMQTCFFAISGVLERDEAIAQIKNAIRKTYGKRGKLVVERNFQAVDQTLANLTLFNTDGLAVNGQSVPPAVPDTAPEFVRQVTAKMIEGRGDEIPVSALPVDGTYPSATTQWEKRNLALEVPTWETDLCIQCGKCVMVCPHAVIRSKLVSPSALKDCPEHFLTAPSQIKGHQDLLYSLQVSVEDCTGCQLCVEACPAKDRSNVGRKALNMTPVLDLKEQERENWTFFQDLPDRPPAGLAPKTVRNLQLLQPTFEFSGACAGCGETPYIKLLTQLFGDRAVVANATGCSSIYGGNLPTTPWSVDTNGRGPAWSNSLFEDNAEFGLGMRLAIDQQQAYARQLIEQWRERLTPGLVDELLGFRGHETDEIEAQRVRVQQLRGELKSVQDLQARDLEALADLLVPRSVWLVGGDGWAYDIGFGGLDHVIANAHNVNILVLDTEVYSNTGGQASKATPLGAVAKFAAAGKATAKKDLGLLAMGYENVYVAQIAMGANDTQALRAFREAESYDGPSLIIAYSQCIAHGIDMARGMNQQKLAVLSGHWPLYRYDPRRALKGENPLLLDSKEPKIPLSDYFNNEGRYRILQHSNPEAAQQFVKKAQENVHKRWRHYSEMAGVEV